LIDRSMKKLVVMACFLFLCSCAEKVIEPPENLISESKMTDILYDLAMLGTMNSNYKEVMEKHDIETMPYIFEKYAIDSVQFVESDVYYASMPLTYEAMYTQVQERLELRIQEIKKAREIRQDSLDEVRKNIKDSLIEKSKKPSKVPALLDK